MLSSAKKSENGNYGLMAFDDVRHVERERERERERELYSVLCITFMIFIKFEANPNNITRQVVGRPVCDRGAIPRK